jgi:D-sedoheptulose 7-phosphate isomerase
MNPVTRYIRQLQTTLDELPVEQIERVIDILYEARLSGKQVFIMGNGGSASTASHFVCDLAKNTRYPGWPHFRVIGLTDNMALFSALANDDGYENVFAQQLESLVRPGDIVIGISTSGNSRTSSTRPTWPAASAPPRSPSRVSIAPPGPRGGCRGACPQPLHRTRGRHPPDAEHLTVTALKERAG